MPNTKHNWYAGMPVIMTADSRKGDTDGFPDGEYKGEVVYAHISVIGGYEVSIKSSGIFFFLLDGSCSTHPGMSIRPADYTPGQIPIEKPEIIKETCPDCGGQIRSHEYQGRYVGGSHICQPTTPSQWIRGRVPSDYIGEVWLSNSIEVALRYHAGRGHFKIWSSKENENVGSHNYTHYMYKEPILFPPPPVAEVEAYGFLECVSKAKYDDIKYIENARRFYSQPATAEFVDRYLKRKDSQKIQYSITADTLDDYIREWKRGLLFKAAALKELGIK